MGGGQNYESLVGWGENMMIHKEKNVNLKGKWWKNVGKKEIFTVLRRKNIIWEKKEGGGQIYHILGIYTPLL